MNQTQIGELLCKQLELLAERSKECTDEELAGITSVMVEVYEALHNNERFEVAKEIFSECKTNVDPEEFERMLNNAPVVNLPIAESILSSRKEI